MRFGNLFVQVDRLLVHWIIIISITLILVYLQNDFEWLLEYPDAMIIPLSDWLNIAMNSVIKQFGWFFMGISWTLEWPIKFVRWILQSLPWTVSIFLFSMIAYAASGWRLSLFTMFSCIYMLIIGYWIESLNTLSLVIISVPLAILTGFGFGVLGFYSKRAERFIMPMLDIFQTVPTFAYLLPILLLFGFGTVVGLIGSVVYSFPPMVHNTIVGLRSVSSEVIEAGLMSGATPSQLFWQVRVPSAWRQLLLGVNQATMASLSMVIIASIVGGTGDIGWEVLSTINKAQFGESLLAGLVIALMAMVIDRITVGLANSADRHNLKVLENSKRGRYFLLAVLGALLFYITSQLFDILAVWPKEMEVSLARPLNDALTYLVVNYRTEIEMIKKFAFFFVMLPTKIGLQSAVSPFTWGFSLMFAHKIGYIAATILLAALISKRWSTNAGIFVVLFSIFFYFGLTGLPWPALLLIYGFAAWRIGGLNLGIGTVAGLFFIVATGIWSEAMLSLYVCGIAVVISFILGSCVGIWAASNDTVSAIVRPFNDTMQTMPLFVILIPFVMLFKIGDFTALLAIIAYAIVPAIRYSEHGLRGVSANIIEAANMMGATRSQMLWQVKIPLAMPVIMLGLNQTVMYGIAMLVIASFVGTNGLEQIVFIGLSDGNFGVGIIAGVSMAIIAIIIDRMTQSWSRKRSRELGI